MSNTPRSTRHVLGACAAAAVVLCAAGCSSATSKPSGATKPPASTSAPSSGSTAAPTTAASTPPPATPSRVKPRGSYAVGSLSTTYIDRSRGTDANRSAGAQPTRTLPTFILYPAQGTPTAAGTVAGAKPAPGPWPLIVFSHGVTGTGPAYVATLRHFASAGYVVFAPDYPLSKMTAPGGPSISDVPAQTGDVHFLIDRAIAASKAAGPLHGLIDPARIGLAGHSLGAITSLGAGYNACCADHRVRAVAEYAGIFFPLASGGRVDPKAAHTPLLEIHGDNDGTVPYSNGATIFAKLGAPKFFITLPGQGHTPPYVQGLNSPASAVTTNATIDFFDRYLKQDPAGLTRLHQVIDQAGSSVATLQAQPK